MVFLLLLFRTQRIVELTGMKDGMAETGRFQKIFLLDCLKKTSLQLNSLLIQGTVKK